MSVNTLFCYKLRIGTLQTQFTEAQQSKDSPARVPTLAARPVFATVSSSPTTADRIHCTSTRSERQLKMSSQK
jgi:hypothetical protein